MNPSVKLMSTEHAADTLRPLCRYGETSAAPSRPPIASSPATAYHIFLNCKYFPLLDGLRCLSIVAVVWFHAAGTIYHHSELLSRGYLGVSLFFVISGFLITTLLLREQSGTGNISLKRFYLRRAFRIFPLYYAVVALYVVLVSATETHSAAGKNFWHNLPYFLTYTSNWFVPLGSDRVIFYFAWSLAAEEQFYLFWPWVVNASARPYLPLGVMAGLLTLHYSSGFGVDRGFLNPTSFLTVVLTEISPPICLGAIAAVLMHRPTSFDWINRWMGWRYSPICALAALLIALAFDATPDWVDSIAMTWLVVACVLQPDQPLGYVLTNPLIKHIGIVSYGIYLTHMLCVNAARRLVHVSYGPLVFVLGFAISIFVATLSYYFFESPFLHLKDRLTKGPEWQPALSRHFDFGILSRAFFRTRISHYFAILRARD